MYYPLKYKNFFTKIHGVLEKPFFKFFFVPLLIMGPPSICVFVLKTDLSNSILYEAVMTFIVAAISLCTNGFVKWIAKKAEENRIPKNDFLMLMSITEEIVKRKADRFQKSANRVLAGKLNPKDVFQNITQPEEQIIELARGIHAYLKQQEHGASTSISVAKIADNKKPIDWLWYSREPRTKISRLEDKCSAISRCLEKRDTIIIADIGKECRRKKNKRYLSQNDGVIEEGSLIAFPIICRYQNKAKIPYVFTIKSTEKSFFNDETKPYYDWIVRHFVPRINLECNLQVMKDCMIDDAVRVSAR